VIDPASCATLPDGQTGELLFTSLTKQALPIIRYRTRDLTALRPGTARPAFRRLDKVTGRSDDLIILRGVTCSPPRSRRSCSAPPVSPPISSCDCPPRPDGPPHRRRRSPHDADARHGTAAAEVVTRVKEGVGVTVDVQVVARGRWPGRWAS